MGAVTKQAFQNVADHFLGIRQEKEIRILPESVREEVRAEQLFHQKKGQGLISHLHENHFPLGCSHPLQEEDNQRKLELFIQKDPQQRMIEIPLPSNQRLEEKPSQKTFWQTIKASFKGELPQVSSSSSVVSEKRDPSSAAFEKEMLPQPKNGKEYYMTEEFKREMLGKAFYQKTVSKNASPKASQVISEELKREMLGDRFYNRSYKKVQTPNTREIEKLSRMHVFSHIEEDQAHHEQDVSLSQKTPSRGRKR
ncbi:MAG: hypothetical protein EKK64_05620 [Neisseriaceae bacterium]|nr:MAG: hypothetical protein EKK64_05620 [Neisseriaceae bacterium]